MSECKNCREALGGAQKLQRGSASEARQLWQQQGVGTQKPRAIGAEAAAPQRDEGCGLDSPMEEALARRKRWPCGSPSAGPPPAHPPSRSSLTY